VVVKVFWHMLWPGGMMSWMGGYGALMAAYWIASLIAVLWALIDISHSKKDGGYKLIWAFVCIVLGLIGVLIYHISEKNKTLKRKK
jgi:hypothetical protein